MTCSSRSTEAQVVEQLERRDRPRKAGGGGARTATLLEQHFRRRREDLVDRQRGHAERGGVLARDGEEASRRSDLSADAAQRKLIRHPLHESTHDAVGQTAAE